MFKKFVRMLLEASTEQEVNNVLYGENGVSKSFEKDKIKWDEHEMLFRLAGRICDSFN